MSKKERQEFRVSLEDVRRDVSDILEEEQEKYENMPESLQNGSRGEAMQEAIDNLEQAVEAIESAIANEDVEDEEWPANMESDLSDAVDLLNSF
jgi:hypothetical protein